MLKKVFAAVVLMALLLTSAGCGMLAPAAPKTYHNGYLGLAVTVPTGWRVTEINETNATATPGESGTMEDLEIEEYGDGTGYVQLLSFQNRHDSANNSHIAMDFSAEEAYSLYPTLEQYVDTCISYNTGDSYDDETEISYYGTLIGQEDGVSLGGMAFTKLTIQVESEDLDVPYIEEYYLCSVGDLYVTVYTNYWSDNPAAKSEAMSVLSSCFTLASSDEARRDGDRVPAAATLYNTVLGLTVEIPEGKYMRQIDSYNLTDTPGDTLSMNNLNGEAYEDGGFYYNLLQLSPLTGEDAVLELYAEQYEGFASLDAFVDACVEAYTADTGSGSVAALTSRETAVIDGIEYSHLVLSVDSVDGESMRSEYYICQRGEGLYFFAYISYATDDITKALATEMLSVYSLGEISAGVIGGGIGEAI